MLWALGQQQQDITITSDHLLFHAVPLQIYIRKAIRLPHIGLLSKPVAFSMTMIAGFMSGSWCFPRVFDLSRSYAVKLSG